MISELSKTYEPEKVEKKIYQLWLKTGFFNPDKLPKSSQKKPKTYSIVIPPPNITGELHMGHAMNATIQDILIRKKRMEGFKTLWLPGTDHAGIATQNVVEKNLKKEGLSRFDLGREKFIEKVWQWREKYGDIILSQFKKIGASCDWSRTRFTMDKDYVKTVETAFLHYYKKGWIYQGERVIRWCPRCKTSLSDLEIEYKEEKGKLWYIKYPIKDGNFIVVATTRPETMLGDTAVAVNPKDKRYKDLVGKTVILPIQNKEIPIIADRLVDINFGTGAVKVTPSHDINDW
ncbi:MAG TPA: class I tRNA ligase family protein, partial [Candidatus Paceibacterota bacterium]|nr:class I tRNA ligase family protein [Candidatus Paceibacterota bacterium]